MNRNINTPSYLTFEEISCILREVKDSLYHRYGIAVEYEFKSVFNSSEVQNRDKPEDSGD